MRAAAPSAEARAVLEAHERVLARWRGAMDLVGPGPLAPHFEDALGAVAGLAARGDWADLGSGAGFPGVALAALHPEARVLLVESRRKRAVFLERVLAEAGLPAARCRVVHGRTEALESGAFDGVISRAYKPPAAYLADAARLLRPGGRAVLLTGDGPPEGLGALEELEGLELLDTTRYPVAGGWRRALSFRRA